VSAIVTLCGAGKVPPFGVIVGVAAGVVDPPDELLLVVDPLDDELLVVVPELWPELDVVVPPVVLPELVEVLTPPLLLLSSPPQAMPAAAAPTISAASPATRKLSLNLMPIVVLPLHATCMEHCGPIGTERDIYKVTARRQ
jgi:hypothetical protein